MPNINDLTDGLIEACDTLLGDTLEYKSAGGAYETLVGPIVDYGEFMRDAGTGMVIEQDVTITVSKRLLAQRPTAADRIKLTVAPTVAYKPINVTDLGTDWQFGIQRV